jgi:anthranilate phosphoribosyltransferase
LAGETGPPRDVVLLNAGAALVAAGTAVSVAEGITIAARSIDEGKASAALDRLVAVSGAAQ